MPNFALVTEGLTDQIIIENIIFGFFDDPDISVNPLQPLRDETDRSRTISPGNWHQVLEYCASGRFRGAFQFNDYVIVQIDTDVAVDYNVSDRDEEGNEFSVEEMIARVRAVLIARIGQEFYDKYASRILFAISVQSIECWLLPLLFSDKKKQSKTINCLGTLNQELTRKKSFSIDPNNKKPEYYEAISVEYTKHRKLMALYNSNPSLEAFVHDLEKTVVVPNADDSSDSLPAPQVPR